MGNRLHRKVAEAQLALLHIERLVVHAWVANISPGAGRSSQTREHG
jgi:hypothetical protein